MIRTYRSNAISVDKILQIAYSIITPGVILTRPWGILRLSDTLILPGWAYSSGQVCSVLTNNGNGISGCNGIHLWIGVRWRKEGFGGNKHGPNGRRQI